jgi:glycosyltransferase involved in cell wall biosynthesis
VIYHSVYLNNSVYELALLYLWMRVCAVRLIIVDHDPRHMFARSPYFVSIYRAVLKRARKVVCIGTSTYQQYAACMPRERSLFCAESAFLPPDLMQERALMQQYPPWVASCIKEGDPLIVGNAGYVYRPNGRDIYGLRALIDLTYDMKDHNNHLRMIIAVGAVGDYTFFDELTTAIDNAGMKDSCLWLVGNYELWPIVRRAHLFVRPTLSDGESISVREALHFGTPVVASDAVARSAGVHLYKTADRADLLRVSRAALTIRPHVVSHADSYQSYS